MKTIVFVFLLLGSLFIFSCKNNDTSTEMPNGGYKERTDSTAFADSLQMDTKDEGAVAVDTVKNGQANISGAVGSDTAH